MKALTNSKLSKATVLTGLPPDPSIVGRGHLVTPCRPGILLNVPKLHSKNSSTAPAHLQPPPGSSCQDILLLFAPLLACRLVKGGGTSFLFPFNHHPTSCTAFSQVSLLQAHFVCSSKLVPESFRYSLFPSPVCPGCL